MGIDTEILPILAGKRSGKRIRPGGDALERPTQNKISPLNASSQRRSSSRDSTHLKTTKSMDEYGLIITRREGRRLRGRRISPDRSKLRDESNINHITKNQDRTQNQEGGNPSKNNKGRHYWGKDTNRTRANRKRQRTSRTQEGCRKMEKQTTTSKQQKILEGGNSHRDIRASS